MGKQLLARGMGASPGTATGHVVFRSEDAVVAKSKGLPVILVRIDTSAEDVPAIQASVAVVTTHGGLTGDAAIIARTLGKPCIASCSALRVDYGKDHMTVRADASLGLRETIVRAGDVLTIDAARGELWREEPEANGDSASETKP